MAESGNFSDIRGLEILFSASRDQLQSPNDALMCLFHAFLISKGLKCTGHGEDGEDGRKTELLPHGWNTCQDVYVLRYDSDDGEKYVLKVVRMDCVLLVHLMRKRDEQVASITIKTGDFTTGDLSSYDRAYKNSAELERKIKTEIWDSMSTKPHSSQRSNTPGSRPRSEDSSRSDDPLRAGPVRSGRPVPPDWADQGDPFSVGRGDLDPFGSHPGGMMMDPMRQGGRPGMGFDPHAGLPGRLPRGAVPPGARFDPFGPPGLGRGSGPGRPGPDPDHMRPPDYDDMFM